MLLSDARIDAEYLTCAPPHEVLGCLHDRWLPRSAKREMLPDRIIPDVCETALLGRSSRVVDIALALVGTATTVEQVLARNSTGSADPSVLLAALRNPIAASGLLNPRPWLSDRLEWIAANGEADHIEALFLNPNLAHDVFDAACLRKGSFATIDSDRFLAIVPYLLRSNLVVDGPRHTKSDYDAAGARCMQSAWQLLADTDATTPMAATLAELVPAFKELSVPFNFERPTSTKTTEWEDREIQFLVTLFAKWASPHESEPNYDPYAELRTAIASKVSPWGKRKAFLLSHPDVAVRKGYYMACASLTADEMSDLLQKDGRQFCEGAAANKEFFARTNRKARQWLLEACGNHGATDERDYRPEPLDIFRWTSNRLSSEDPSVYVSWQEALDEQYGFPSEDSSQTAQPDPLADIRQSLKSLVDGGPSTAKLLSCVLIGVLIGWAIA